MSIVIGIIAGLIVIIAAGLLLLRKIFKEGWWL